MSFAPVAFIDVDLARTAHGVYAVGWAAPRGGHLPCALRLLAGSSLLAVGKATRFSAEAARRGQRLGWCGFRIGDLSAAAALDDEVRLVCAESGEVQARWSAAEAVQRAAPAPRPFQTVADFRQSLLRTSACGDAAAILPFARRLHRLRGDLAVISACYRWTLRRTPPLAEAQQFLRTITDGGVTEGSMERLIGSPEYMSTPRTLVGPFDSAFPFDIGAFDEV